MAVYLVTHIVITSKNSTENSQIIKKLTDDESYAICQMLRYKEELSDFAKRKGWKSKKEPVRFYIEDPQQFILRPLDKTNDKVAKIHYVKIPLGVGMTISKPGAFLYPNIYNRIEYTFKGSLFEHQVEPALQAFKQLQQTKTTSLFLHTGFGKTMIAVWLAVHLQRTAVVVVSLGTLPDQWRDTFLKNTDAKVIDYRREPLTAETNVVICMKDSLTKLAAEFNPGLLIVDEAHLFCTPSGVKPLLATNPEYVIACTATPKRSNGMEKMMHALCGTHSVTRISQKPFNVIKIETGVVIPDEHQTWHQMKEYLNQYGPIIELIHFLVLANIQHKFLILTNSIERTTFLSQMFNERGIPSDWMAKTKKMYKDSKVLVGTVDKVGTGFDEASFCKDFNGTKMDYLILDGSFKSATRTEQAIGRILRAAEPTVIDIVHKHRILTNHFRERAKWYRSRNGKVRVHKLAPQPTIETHNLEYISVNSEILEDPVSGQRELTFEEMYPDDE